TDGSNSLSANSPSVPPEDVNDANVNGLVVNKLSHHVGCVAASRIVRAVSAGGNENPARSSRKRLPPTGTSTVKIRASKPAACARSIKSSAIWRSLHTYN